MGVVLGDGGSCEEDQEVRREVREGGKLVRRNGGGNEGVRMEEAEQHLRKLSCIGASFRDTPMLSEGERLIICFLMVCTFVHVFLMSRLMFRRRRQDRYSIESIPIAFSFVLLNCSPNVLSRRVRAIC